MTNARLRGLRIWYILLCIRIEHLQVFTDLFFIFMIIKQNPVLKTILDGVGILQQHL